MAPSGTRREVGSWHQRHKLGYLGDYHIDHYSLVEEPDFLEEMTLVSRGQPPFKPLGLEVSAADHLAFSRKSKRTGQR